LKATLTEYGGENNMDTTKYPIENREFNMMMCLAFESNGDASNQLKQECMDAIGKQEIDIDDFLEWCNKKLEQENNK